MSVKQVTDVLLRMDELYRDLIELGQKKQEAILANDIASLTEVMTKETRTIKRSAEIDDDREQAVALFLKEKGIRSQLKLTITEMTRLVFDLTEKQELQAAQRKLSDTLLELKRLNAINRELIEQSLVFIDYSLNLFMSEPEDEMLYRNPAQQHPVQKPRSFFDTRA